MTKPTFLCIKWGKKYGCEYVNRLFNGVDNNMDADFRFVCLTDNKKGIDKRVEIYPLPDTGFDENKFDSIKGGETWRKVGLFKPDIADLDGDVIFLDLDVVITGKLDDLFEYQKGKFVVIQDWLEKRRSKVMLWRDGRVGNTSVFRFNPKQHSKVFEHFSKNTQWALNNFRIEQQYVSWVLRNETVFWKPQWICSFKRNCCYLFPLNLFLTPKKPDDMRILVFHGHPLPNQAIKGYKKNIFKSSKPCKWLSKYWN
ncbi:MAG: hypothetical protein P8N25_02395 [Alphaproteobacteria bacterium]|nr:hypothetical protein [Alphaproteobacteria bacterium]